MHPASDASAINARLDGGVSAVLRRSLAADADAAALAVVFDTAGSTYARSGDVALYAQGQRLAGWLTGGCLDEWLAQEAAAAVASGRVRWLELDLSGPHALLDPSAPGCRGRQWIAFVPLAAWRGWEACVRAWQDGTAPIILRIDPRTGVRAACADLATAPVAGGEVPAWLAAQPPQTVSLALPPLLALLGGGPEAPLVLQLAAELGWATVAAENRPRWFERLAAADVRLDGGIPAFFASAHAQRATAILAMNHNLERDLLALRGAADTAARYIGLLGPRTRRDDVMRLLREDERARLAPRLHPPVGLPFPAKGPAAIAVSVVAHLMMEFAHAA